ncbi:MAG: hypothetical protein HQL01_01790 [Nitrospirae bacterium]|nr:hypothetical protein [Nitrospirota bacterium]
MTKFDDLIKTIGKFVDIQKGTWDHLEWERLVSKVKQMGYEMSGDIMYNLGTSLEAFKKLYLSKTSKDDLNKIVADIPKSISSFIDETKGMWEHADWLRLLKEIEKAGVTLTEETQKYIGDLLEGAKRLYSAPYKEPAVVIKPKVETKPVEMPAEIKRPATAEVERPVEVKKPAKAEVKKPYETEMEKYIETKVKKHVAEEAKKLAPVEADKLKSDKAEKKAAPKAAESKDSTQKKAKRPYNKKG